MKIEKLHGKRLAVSTVLLLGMVFSNVTWAVLPKTASAETSSDVISKQNELKTLQQQIEETRSQLFTKKKEESNALVALENIELELERLQSRIDVQNKKLKTAESNLATTEKGISNVERQIDELANELDMRADDISELMVKIYKTGPGTYLEVLFASNSLQDFVNRYEYLNMIVESDTDIFNEVKTQKSEVEAKKQELVELLAEQENKKKEIEEIKRELETEEKEVSTALKEKEFYLKRVQAERERYEAELEEEERQSKALEQVIKDLQAKEKDSAKLSGYTSPFMWPTIDGRISSPYGWRVHPILGGNRYHSGIDIAVPSGSPVYAAADGKVLLAGWVTGYGNTVIIDHGGSITTLYGHNSVLKTTAGKTVKKGDLIALVGSTGNSTGPHLHFEVRKDGVAQDPFNWVPAR